MTFAEKLAQSDGRPTGFDYLRITLSLLVLTFHVGSIGYGRPGNNFFWDGYLLGVVNLIVPMFFSLSGFLVAGSLERSSSLFVFLGLRGLRIFPALAVEVVLSAFVLGAIYTTLPLYRYFSDPLFLRYLVNITGHISYFLPGVFNQNFDAQVNGQLWTVPFELFCYISLAIFWLIGGKKRPRLIWASAMIVALIPIALAIYHKHNHQEVAVGHLASGGRTSLVALFLTSVGMYLFREKIVWNHKLGLSAGLACYILYQFSPDANLFSYPLIAYFTCYIGLSNPKKTPIIDGADYSYGIYLYGFPIQQAIATYGPNARSWFVLFPISLIVSCVFAAGSWHFIEKPTLKLKKILPLIELRWRRRSEPRPVTEKDSATPDAAREVDPIRRTTGVEI